jgi:hypothetical protein
MDFRVSASELLVDREAYHDWKASTRAEAGTALTYQRSLLIDECDDAATGEESGVLLHDADDDPVGIWHAHQQHAVVLPENRAT